MSIKFSEVVEKLGQIEHHSLVTVPDCNPILVGLAAVDLAQTGHLSYIEGDKFANLINTTGASALILPPNETLQQKATQRSIAWIATNNPRLLFAIAIGLFYQPFVPAPGIHPTAIISPTAIIGDDVYIGPYVVIQDGVTIGQGVCIHPHVVIYPQVSIGDRSTLHANCTIHERTRIGSNCVIHSGAVVGAEGFGFVPIPEGWFKIQQSGYTVLEDGVEVGCNSGIDRPTVGETRIGKNTKIDNLVQIGHGCKIGQACAIAGQVGLAGGVKLGDRVILAGQVGVANQAYIGDNVTVTAQSGVNNDISPKQVVSGSPAIPHHLFLKVAAIYKRLPDMYEFYRSLSRKNKP